MANFTNNPNNRTYQPRAYSADYHAPEKVYQYTFSIQRELGYNMTFTAAYVGSQGRNLFLRSITNQITEVRTNANPASAAVVIRQFDIINADGSISGPTRRSTSRRAAAMTSTTRSSSPSAAACRRA